MFTATCHCGDVEIEALAEPDRVTQCNCSICRRTGAIYVYGTRRDYRLVRPALADLDTYSCEDHVILFYRCRRCGCHVFHEAAEKSGDDTRIGVNIRMVDPDAIRHLPMRLLNGADDWSDEIVSDWRLNL